MIRQDITPVKKGTATRKYQSFRWTSLTFWTITSVMEVENVQRKMKKGGKLWINNTTPMVLFPNTEVTSV